LIIIPIHYKKIKDSSEGMDMVYALVSKIKTPKEIAEKLEKGSNVRSNSSSYSRIIL